MLSLPTKKTLQQNIRFVGDLLRSMAMKKVGVVALLDIYPKRGPRQQLEEDDKELLKA